MTARPLRAAPARSGRWARRLLAVAVASLGLAVAAPFLRAPDAWAQTQASAWSPLIPPPAGFLPDGRLSCPSNTLCWVLGTQGATVTQHSVFGGVSYWETEGGHSAAAPLLDGQWGPVASLHGVGGGDGSELAISCPSTSTCLVAGGFGAAALTGGSWRVSPWPSGFEYASAVACPTTELCWALGRSGANGVPEADEWVAGQGWATSPERLSGNPNDLVVNLACPSATDCLAAGYLTGSASPLTPGPLVWTQWAPSSGWAPLRTVAALAGPNAYPPLSCSPSLCAATYGVYPATGWMLAWTPLAGWFELASPFLYLQPVACASDGRCLVAGALTTSGAFSSEQFAPSTGWVASTLASLPPSDGALPGLACPTSSSCWLSTGWSVGPQGLSTRIGVAHWTLDAPPVAPAAPLPPRPVAVDDTCGAGGVEVHLWGWNLAGSTMRFAGVMSRPVVMVTPTEAETTVPRHIGRDGRIVVVGPGGAAVPVPGVRWRVECQTRTQLRGVVEATGGTTVVAVESTAYGHVVDLLHNGVLVGAGVVPPLRGAAFPGSWGGALTFTDPGAPTGCWQAVFEGSRHLTPSGGHETCISSSRRRRTPHTGALLRVRLTLAPPGRREVPWADFTGQAAFGPRQQRRAASGRPQGGVR